MHETSADIGQRVGRALAAAGRFAARFALGLLCRGYALALMALILWASWGALRYLVNSLVTPTPTPGQIAGVPKRLDEALLQQARPDWLGLSSVENPRGPLSHFHRFETWIQNDRFNDCTRGGCHAPLPHSQKKEVRAFLNMHATSLHCGVCHMNGQDAPRPLVWYDLDDARPRSRPALLDVYDWLERHANSGPSGLGSIEQREIAGLLRSAAREGQDEPYLDRLARDITAVRAGSDALADLLDQALDAVRRALRGSYGSKLALHDATGKPILGHPETEAAVQEWLARGSQASGPERERLLKAVHPRRLETALDCTACHRAQGSLIDFAAAGYPAARVHSLTEPRIFEMIQHIREGRPFYIPTVRSAESKPAPSP